MADNLKNSGFGAFDGNGGQKRGEDNKGVLSGLLSVISNRYFIMGLGFSLFGVIILIMTARLQFSDYQNTISQASKGVSRQMTVNAPRGDIYDRNGILLASSTSYNVIYIANAGLDDDTLNAECLELSYLFEEYNCTTVSSLDDYLIVTPGDPSKYEFLKEEEDIKLWQTDSNLFDLDDFKEGIIVTYSDRYVKTDPEVFFLYLRRLFKVDTSYSVEEAYRIIRLRYQIFKDNWMFLKGTPVEIASDCPEELISLVTEQNYHYAGIVTGKEYSRTYSPWALYSCHVLGYVGQISQESYAQLQDFGYTSTDMVGKSGVEAQMERYLHGNSGTAPYNIWTPDGVDGAFFPSEYGVPASPGATVNLTIDSRLQEVGITALKDYIAEAQAAEARRPKGYKTASSGAFVMMKVDTGAVLAMGSYPNFDPNDFILANYDDPQAKEQVKYYLGIDEYEDVTAQDLPLWNRAIMSMYAPGSTFKPITALAALEQKEITPNSNWIKCESPIDIGGWIFRCLEYPYTGHGALNLDSAMATSCNIYFMRLGVKTGIDYISRMALKFGLGVKSGIDIPGEISGVVASRETKRLLHESEYDRTWFPANTAQSSIGQFDNCFTILQLCRYTAAVATNKLVTPYVIDSVVASDGSILYQGGADAVDIGISDENIQAVRRAMRCVVTGTSQWRSTARNQFNNFPVEVVCKTGTAETGYEEIRKEYSNGLFICYAPKENPEVAIALVVEKGEWGASTIVIAKKLLAAYFNVDPDTSSAAVKNYPTTTDVLDSITPTAG
ncbi:penicillin-binding protein 2 [Ruminococcaceae bacterium YRB3002]|nr:penicillin-binding protein 2 [Ruminococcaceae bacterium YRB3002]